jgi:MFS family permease
MTRRLAALGLACYPLAFRRRYGAEMRALLDETPARADTLADLWRGALVAHLRPPAGLNDRFDRDDRLRASASGILACWVAFAAAGCAFALTTEDLPFWRAGSRHPVLGSAHAAIQLLAIVASVAVIAGALPLIVAALKHARGDRSVRFVVSLPAAAVAGFVMFTVVVGWIFHHHRIEGRIAFVAWIFVAIGCAAVCVVASRIALFAVPVARRWLLAAFACGAVVTAAMLAIAAATALYTIVLSADLPALAGAPNGPLAAPGVGASLALQLIVMSVAGALATTSTRRGWRAVSASTTFDEGNACQ